MEIENSFKIDNLNSFDNYFIHNNQYYRFDKDILKQKLNNLEY